MRLTEEVTVGERVAFFRRRKGITQEVLAGLLGRSVEWLAQFERGTKELDRLSTIVARERLLAALGPAPIDIDELARATGLAARAIQVALLELTLAGRVERHGHQLVSRKE